MKRRVAAATLTAIRRNFGATGDASAAEVSILSPVTSFDARSSPLLIEALEVLEEGFAGLPALEGASPGELERLRSALLEAAGRLRDNYPYHTPDGQ